MQTQSDFLAFLGATTFKVDAGRKGARAEWDTEITLDLESIAPEHLPAMLTYLIARGLTYHIKQAANGVENAQAQAEKDGKPIPDGPELAKKLMLARWAEMCQGETGARNSATLTPVHKRALELIKGAIREAAKAKGMSVTDDRLTQAAKDTLGTPKATPFIELAAKQLEEERNRATGLASADDLLSVLG